ncbi:MAG: hypothetical protein R6V56_05980 [Lentisphaeria bacterium]
MDMEWKGGELTEAVLYNVANHSGNCFIRYGDKTRKMNVARGTQALLNPSQEES